MAVTLGHRKEDDKQNKQRGSVGCAVHHHHQCQAEFTSNHVLFIILNSVFVKDILASLVFSCKTVNCSSAPAVFSLFLYRTRLRVDSQASGHFSLHSLR